jgi:hypothetical protein
VSAPDRGTIDAASARKTIVKKASNPKTCTTNPGKIDPVR